MVKLTLYYGFQRHELEADPEDGLETLFYQVFSLTNVAPEDQALFGLQPGPLTLETAAFSTATFAEGHVIALMEPMPDLVPHASGDSLSSLAHEFAQSWQTTCTRAFFGEESIHQPVMATTSSTGRPPVFVCFSCATTCYLPQQVTSVKAAGLMAQRGFTCGCHIAKLAEGGCLFGPRVGSESVSGPARAAMLQAINAAYTHQQLRLSLQEKTSAVPAPRQQQVSDMLARLTNCAKHVGLYQIPANQAEALRVIPVAELCKRAQENPSPKSTARLEILYQLLRWFRNEFFKWTNAPACSFCGSNTRSVGAAPPTPEERAGMAGVTEVYQCTNAACNQLNRFPRYNDPKKLLSWRQGRCGEWTNCFTLCCIAMGYDARHCTDWTDHVWTEVWSTYHKRWLHLDPAETAFDTPLLYEAGWGKKLTYVIAANKDEVVDVTKRYTKKYDEVLTRRTSVNEEWLADAVALLDHAQKYQIAHVSPQRLEELTRRRAFEARELEANIAIDSGERKLEELQGRISGSLAWRRLRGEMGESTSLSAAGGVSTSGSTSTIARDEAVFGWSVIGPADPVTATVKMMSSFGEQWIAVGGEGSLVWCQHKALVAQLAGTGPATPSAWKKLLVWDEAGALWPIASDPIRCMSAQTGTMRMVAVTQGRGIWLMVPGPKPIDPSGTTVPDAARKVSRCARIGEAPAGISDVAVLDGRLYAIVTRDGTTSLWQWGLSLDEACTFATSKFTSDSPASLPPAAWSRVLDCDKDSRILTIGRALYNVSASGIAVFVNTGLLSPSLTISGDHGVTFHAPPMIHVSSRFQLRIQRTRASGDDFKDDWIGLMKVGQPNECETTCVVDIDALEASGSATDFTFEWPADRLPTSPGVYEFRYFSGIGFHKRRCMSAILLVVPTEPAKFAWLHLFDAKNVSSMTHAGQLVIAVADSKEVCSAALPTNLAMFQSMIPDLTVSPSPKASLGLPPIVPPLSSSEPAPASSTPPSKDDSLRSPRSVESDMKRMFTQLVRGCGDLGCDNPHCATGSGRGLKPNEAAAIALKFVSGPGPLPFCKP